MDARIDMVSGAVNSWVVGDDAEVIVIDPGTDAGAVLSVAGERDVIAVICTHGHARHAAAAFEVARRDDALVAAHRFELPALRETRADARPDIEAEDGGLFKVADVSLEVMHSPGHSPGSICLYSEELGVVFTGDLVGAQGPVPHDGEFPDFSRQVDSIGAVILTLPDDTRVLPGHGGELTVSAVERRFDFWVGAGPEDLARQWAD